MLAATHPPGTAAARLRTGLKDGMRAALPLRLRMSLSRVIGRQRWISDADWWAAELVRDLAERDLNAYHRFLWSNHLAYARTYEPGERFGAERVHPSRRELFDELRGVLAARGVDAARDVLTVLEVGCSMGYLLRHLETDVFPAAVALDGIDIDAYAVRRGTQVLRGMNSRVRLAAADATALPEVFGGRRYDVIVCAGVLMYLREEDAAAAVKAMLRRAQGIVALAGLAHPSLDNARLDAPATRPHDRSLIHNLDALVERAGGRVVHRRWDGARSVDGNTIYFVFAEPGEGAAA